MRPAMAPAAWALRSRLCPGTQPRFRYIRVSVRSSMPWGGLQTQWEAVSTAAARSWLAPALESVPPVAATTILLIVGLVFYAWIHKQKMTQKPTISCQPTAFNVGVLARMPTLRSAYRPLMFLTNGHVETIFAAKTRAKIRFKYLSLIHISEPTRPY